MLRVALGSKVVMVLYVIAPAGSSLASSRFKIYFVDIGQVTNAARVAVSSKVVIKWYM